MIYQNAVTQNVPTVKKFAIRHWWGGPNYHMVRYLSRSGGQSDLEIVVGENTFDTVHEAVDTIVNFRLRYEPLRLDVLKIVGVELEVTQPAASSVRVIREIPLKTL